MELTKEEKMLKETMKILLRDGKAGRNYDAAKARYLALRSPERLHNLSHEIDGVDWTPNYANDSQEIDLLIQ